MGSPPSGLGLGRSLAVALASAGGPFLLLKLPLTRRFPPPWTAKRIPGQSLAYVYARENETAAGTAKVLTIDEARRIASNLAKLPALLARGKKKE